MPERKILVLGSGMVAKPCVDYLLRHDDNRVTVACRTLTAAEDLVSFRPHTQAIALDVTSAELDAHVAAHDVVISLVPFVYHAHVIWSAIRGKTNVVTTSYISEEMRELEGEAKQAGITVLNEVGMDPGVDHLWAVKTISEVHSKGGRVLEFYSFCGGLPAPECSDNPLRFKFSWSPRGALLSQCNSARFLRDGEIVEIPSRGLMNSAESYFVKEGYSFVAYPNRDSVPFREAYNIPEAHTVIRGSLRYEGNPAFVNVLSKLGWLDPEPRPWLKPGMTWAEIQQKATGAASPQEKDLVARVDELCLTPSAAERERFLTGIRWIGLLSEEVPEKVHASLLDTLSAQLEKLCKFQPGERDFVMLQHKFVVEWQDGTKETKTSTLELFGDPAGYSGMAKSVGVTCGIATKMLLDGFEPFQQWGVLAPYSRDICERLRLEVAAEGISLLEEAVQDVRW